MMMTFRAEVEHIGTTAVLRMAGDLDATADTALLDAHRKAVADDPRSLTLDFSGVEYINSSGIALVVMLLTEARGAHRTVRAAGFSAHYRHIFEITRLSEYLTIDDDDDGGPADDSPARATGGTTRA
jgi:anti-sigma B factor antagonist